MVIALSSILLIGTPDLSEYSLSCLYISLLIAVDIAVRFFKPRLPVIKSPPLINSIKQLSIYFNIWLKNIFQYDKMNVVESNSHNKRRN